MSLYYRKVPKQKMVSRVLILDFDETIATPDRKADGDYLVQPDGSINAKLMDAETLKKIIEYAELKGIPIHIVTARAQIPGHLKVITDLLNSVDGLNDNPETSGGFKKDRIHFTGVMIGGEWTYGLPKVDVIKEDIHRKLYPHLPREALLFVEDVLK